jgi:hypothetical protein
MAIASPGKLHWCGKRGKIHADILPFWLRKFQDSNEPKNHKCFDEITVRWSHYLLGTALAWLQFGMSSKKEMGEARCYCIVLSPFCFAYG